MGQSYDALTQTIGAFEPWVRAELASVLIAPQRAIAACLAQRAILLQRDEEELAAIVEEVSRYDHAPVYGSF